MRLTQQTDVSLRILLFLAMHPGEAISVKTISRHFEVSEDFAAKMAKQMVREGLLLSRRGRLGGVMLAEPAEQLKVGELLLKLEPFEPLECVRGEGDCPIAPSCALKAALARATQAFVAVLDGYTLADLVKNRGQLQRLLKLAPRPDAA